MSTPLTTKPRCSASFDMSLSRKAIARLLMSTTVDLVQSLHINKILGPCRSQF